MIENFGWLSLLPPLVAIFLAIRTKQVVVSLFVGIWLGHIILNNGNPLLGFIHGIDACINVLTDKGNTQVIVFSALVGALLALVQVSGGMNGFVNSAAKRGLISTPRRAGLLTWLVGMLIFVESNMSILVSGAVARPIFDKLRISREKLAYICDSTSAPRSIILPLNAWGAFVIGLLADQGIENPVKVMIWSIPFNIYALVAITMVLVLIITNRDFGPMKKAQERALSGKVLRDGAEPLVQTEVIQTPAKEGIPHRAINMLLPVLIMVIMMPLALYLTGDGNIMRGSGSASVLWAVLTGVLVAAIMYRVQGILKTGEIIHHIMSGLGGMIPLAILMLFAFAIGDVCKELGTGPYVASVTHSFVSPKIVPTLLFLVSCVIAFSTGTSWGTFAIMIPIGVPMISLLGLHPGFTVAAILGGGVFGDHCSPISDTTIISSMAAATDHVDHVRTQIPYALFSASIAILGYLIIGLIL